MQLLIFDATRQDWTLPANPTAVGRDQRSVFAVHLVDVRRDLVDELTRRGSSIRRVLSDLEVDDSSRSDIEGQLRELSSNIVSQSATLEAIRVALLNLEQLVGTMGTPTLSPLPIRLEELARAIGIDLDTGHGSMPARLHGSGSRSLASLQVQGVLYDRRLGKDGPALRPFPLTLIEEPEAHLHPQAHLELADLLTALPGQVIASTHSSHLVTAIEPRAIRLVRQTQGATHVIDLGRLYAHIVIDEAQNLTVAQYSLITTLLGPDTTNVEQPSMVLIGDDKQSIVQFAGADPGLMARFANEYNAAWFELSRNLRSARIIAQLGESVAAQLVTSNTQRISYGGSEYIASGLIGIHHASSEEDEAQFVLKWIEQLLGEGLPETALAPEEARRITHDQIAVLARSAAGLRCTRTALEAADHPVAMSSSPEDWLRTGPAKIIGELLALRTALDHQSTHWQLARLLEVNENEVKSLEGLSHVIESHSDAMVRALAELSVTDELDKFMDMVGQLDMPEEADEERLIAWDSDQREWAGAWQAFVQRTDSAAQTWGNFRLFVGRLQRGEDLDPGIRLLTVHKAQGREYRAVAVVGLNDGRFPDFRSSDAESYLSELRTFYVAITRPSRLLLVTRARSCLTRYGRRTTQPSPFLDFVTCLPDVVVFD